MAFWIDQQVVAHCEKKIHTEIFVPKESLIVLGSSNDPTAEVFLEEAELQNIGVFKRAGGGGTVVLYPGCVVISVGMWVEKPFENQFYFTQLNNAVAEFIQGSAKSQQPINISQRGISDLAIDGRKFAGTSLFRSRSYLLYQASLIFNLELELIDTLLRHPTREPDYRAGRSHREFLMGLKEYFPSHSIQDFCVGLIQNRASFENNLAPISCNPDISVIPHLRRRFELADRL